MVRPYFLIGAMYERHYEHIANANNTLRPRYGGGDVAAFDKY